MSHIDWIYDDDDFGEENLTGHAKEGYVDVEKTRFGKWSVFLNEKKIKDEIPTREEAKRWVETHQLMS